MLLRKITHQKPTAVVFLHCFFLLLGKCIIKGSCEYNWFFLVEFLIVVVALCRSRLLISLLLIAIRLHTRLFGLRERFGNKIAYISQLYITTRYKMQSIPISNSWN